MGVEIITLTNADSEGEGGRGAPLNTCCPLWVCLYHSILVGQVQGAGIGEAGGLNRRQIVLE